MNQRLNSSQLVTSMYKITQVNLGLLQFCSFKISKQLNNLLDEKLISVDYFSKLIEKLIVSLEQICSFNNYHHYFQKNQHSRIFKSPRDENIKMAILKQICPDVFQVHEDAKKPDDIELCKLDIHKQPIRVVCLIRANDEKWEQCTIYPLFFDLKHCIDSSEAKGNTNKAKRKSKAPSAHIPKITKNDKTWDFSLQKNYWKEQIKVKLKEKHIKVI